MCTSTGAYFGGMSNNGIRSRNERNFTTKILRQCHLLPLLKLGPRNTLSLSTSRAEGIVANRLPLVVEE